MLFFSWGKFVSQVLCCCRCQERAHQQTQPVIRHQEHFLPGHLRQPGSSSSFLSCCLQVSSRFPRVSSHVPLPRFRLSGPKCVAHAAALPVPAAADASGGLYLLKGALRRERPLAGLAWPDHLRRKSWDSLLLPEESGSPQRRRPAAASGWFTVSTHSHSKKFNKSMLFA